MSDLDDWLANASPDTRALNADLVSPPPKQSLQGPEKGTKKKSPSFIVPGSFDQRKQAKEQTAVEKTPETVTGYWEGEPPEPYSEAWDRGIGWNEGITPPSPLSDNEPNGTSLATVRQYDPSWAITDEWTGTEKRFAREYLLPLVLDGTYLWVMPQVEVYMIGQRYTFDFVCLRRDGGADHYEVKGAYQLGSEERASAKIRWATAFLREKPDSLHRVFWVAWRSMRGNPPQWHVREIHPDRKLHPIFQEVKQ